MIKYNIVNDVLKTLKNAYFLLYLLFFYDAVKMQHRQLSLNVNMVLNLITLKFKYMPKTSDIRSSYLK